MKVAELEAKLLALLPPEHAEGWDRTGMLVGDPQDNVGSVAVALDPNRAALSFAKECGANVLLAHHPIFLDPPQAFMPGESASDIVGSRVWQAIRDGISVISFHTALDAHSRAAGVLADPLGLSLTGELLEQGSAEGYGYGRIARAQGSLMLGELAERCVACFGRAPRVWGRPDAAVNSACLWTGSAGDSPFACVSKGIDVLVCGEVKYHVALDACEAGLAIVELGHDVSEQVHVPVLVELLQDCGIEKGRIFPMDLPQNWG